MCGRSRSEKLAVKGVAVVVYGNDGRKILERQLSDGFGAKLVESHRFGSDDTLPEQRAGSSGCGEIDRSVLGLLADDFGRAVPLPCDPLQTAGQQLGQSLVGAVRSFK